MPSGPGDRWEERQISGTDPIDIKEKRASHETMNAIRNLDAIQNKAFHDNPDFWRKRLRESNQHDLADY